MKEITKNLILKQYLIVMHKYIPKQAFGIIWNYRHARPRPHRRRTIDYYYK
jgi:hypothetical protein